MWQEQAACRGTDVNLFIIIDQDHPEAADLDDRARKALTVANFKKAESICSDCPVRAVCEESMAEDDRTWTFRAGLWPKKFTIRTAGRPRRDVNQNKSGKFKACELHNNKGSDGRCLTCKAESRKRFRDAHSLRQGPGAWSRPDGTCQRGHNEWDPKDGRCIPCRRKANTASKAKSRAALKAASVVQS